MVMTLTPDLEEGVTYLHLAGVVVEHSGTLVGGRGVGETRLIQLVHLPGIKILATAHTTIIISRQCNI